MFKKLATVVCATAVALSTMTGMVANAAISRDEGVNLVAEKTADNQITLSVYSVGYDSIRNYGLFFTVDGAAVSTVDIDYAALDTKKNIYGNGGNVAITGSSDSEVSLTSNLMFTITLTLTANISQDITITLDDECTVMKGDRDTLEYYVEDYEDDPDLVTLGFNDAVVEYTVAPPTPVVSTTPGVSRAFTKADNYDENVVVGTIELTVSGAPIDLTKITYNDKVPQKVEGYANPEAFEGTALITVIINGETDVDALNNIKFN